MSTISQAYLTDRLELADALFQGRNTMFEPQDLPGRYGRVIQAIDRLLAVLTCPAVLGGGWAVWRHGYIGRITQDVDIVLPADRVQEFLQVASVSGFEVLPQLEGRWPKVRHKETDIGVDILPEGARPGTSDKPAPTTIPHPRELGAAGSSLRYMQLPGLVQLKLAAGRVRDEADIVELIRANPDQLADIRQQLAAVQDSYAESFDRLAQRAGQQQDH